MNRFHRNSPSVHTSPTPLENPVHRHAPEEQKRRAQWCTKSIVSCKIFQLIRESVLTCCPFGPGSPGFPGIPITPTEPLFPGGPVWPGKPLSPWKRTNIFLTSTTTSAETLTQTVWSQQATGSWPPHRPLACGPSWLLSLWSLIKTNEILTFKPGGLRFELIFLHPLKVSKYVKLSKLNKCWCVSF